MSLLNQVCTTLKIPTTAFLDWGDQQANQIQFKMQKALSHFPRHQNRNQRGYIQKHNLGKHGEDLNENCQPVIGEKGFRSPDKLNSITSLSQFCNNAPQS